MSFTGASQHATSLVPPRPGGSGGCLVPPLQSEDELQNIPVTFPMQLTCFLEPMYPTTLVPKPGLVNLCS